MIEHNVEEAVTEYGESIGYLSRKMTYTGRHGCRDRDFYGHGHIIPIEFKRPGGRPRPHQDRERERMTKVGIRIFVVDDVAKGCALLDRFAAAPRRMEAPA